MKEKLYPKILSIHGFYKPDGKKCTAFNDKHLGGDMYETEDTSCYVHKDTKYMSVVLKGFKYDKCSKGFLKRGGSLTPICRHHDGWFASEYLSLIKANNEMSNGMRLLKSSWFRISYHWLFTTVLGYPFRWYSEKFKGVSHSDEAIKEARKYVRLYKRKKNRWVDITDDQLKWNGEILV